MEGYYRPGRYLPVRLAVSGTNRDTQALTLAGAGTLTTEIPMTEGRADVVAPVLALRGELRDLTWSLSGKSGPLPPLKPLGPGEKLVAFAGEPPGPADLRRLFPGSAVVPVRLDLTRRPLLFPTAAYEAMDGLVLDAASAGAVDQSALETLLAAGTTVAIRSDARPGGDWPWRRAGAFWVLRYEPAWPIPAIETEAYTPTYAWIRGWPARVRRDAILLAGVIALAISAATLWRSKHATAAALGVCIVATLVVFYWASGRSRELSAGGAIEVSNGVLTQHDEWEFRSTLASGNITAPFRGATHPVFAGTRQMAAADVHLNCAADGHPVLLTGRLPLDGVLAFVTRAVRPAAPDSAPLTLVTSPLAPLADRLYPGRVKGQTVGTPPADAGESWGTILLERETLTAP